MSEQVNLSDTFKTWIEKYNRVDSDVDQLRLDVNDNDSDISFISVRIDGNDSDISNLQTALDGKSDTGHVHQVSEITDIVDAGSRLIRGQHSPRLQDPSVVDNSIPPGVYHYDEALGSFGGPGDSDGHILHMRKESGGGELQVFFGETSSRIYTRWRVTSGWSAWNEFSTLTDIQTLSNKTIASPVINTSVTGTAIASQAEAEAGTVTNKLMTPERVAQAITALGGGGGLGDGQVWQDVSASRSAGVSYQNTQGRPIEVIIQLDAGFSTTFIEISSDNVNWVNLLKVAEGANDHFASFTVPDGHYYRIDNSDGTNINIWAELY